MRHSPVPSTPRYANALGRGPEVISIAPSDNIVRPSVGTRLALLLSPGRSVKWLPTECSSAGAKLNFRQLAGRTSAAQAHGIHCQPLPVNGMDAMA